MPLDQDLTEFTTASQVLLNYNYTDIASGTGYITYFLLSSYNTSTSHMLDNNINYSQDIEFTSSTTTSTTFVKVSDTDFDLTEFKISQTIGGIASANMTIGIPASPQVEGYVIVKVRKWDGSTETDIASGQSKTKASIGGTGGNLLENIDVTIPKTLFSIGDVLRITIEGWARSPDGINLAKVTYGIDPKNRDGTVIIPSTDDPVSITTSLINIPFEIIL